MRVHILGASGAGTTTLAAAAADALQSSHFDADDFYWSPSDPPFQIKRPPQTRRELLGAALARADSWVLSGSLMGWGDGFIPLFDLVVFVRIPHAIRMERLRIRERQRYGTDIDPGGVLQDKSSDFLEWAEGYERSGFPGRSLARHEAWLADLTCPVIRIEGNLTTDEQLDRVLAAACP